MIGTNTGNGCAAQAAQAEQAVQTEQAAQTSQTEQASQAAQMGQTAQAAQTEQAAQAFQAGQAAQAAQTERSQSTGAAGQKITEVVAALIWEGGRFLICQRPAHKARGMLWEFVGGKVEPGETKEQALVRECREELAVTLSVGEVFMEVDHIYPDLPVQLTLLHAAICAGTPQMLEHNDLRWITVDEIPQYPFCPADETILRRLQECGTK